MKFPRPSRTRSADSIVPMINVVFLLLIFFLMSAEFAPPAPFDVTPPEADIERLTLADDTLYLDAAGRPGYGDAVGAAVWRLLALRGGKSLVVRADGALLAADLAKVLRELARIGITEVDLAVRTR